MAAPTAAAAGGGATETRLRCVAVSASGSHCRHWVVNRGNKCAMHLAKQDGLAIQESEIAFAGLGLFTLVQRHAGDRVVPYDGARVRFLGRKPSGAFGGAYVLQITPTTFVDAESHASGAGRFVNMCRPENAKPMKRPVCRLNNCHFEWDDAEERAWVVATEDISTGSELLVDYGQQYFPEQGQAEKKKKKKTKSPARRRTSLRGTRRASLTPTVDGSITTKRGRTSLRLRRSLSAKA
jgi:hypothetical protein